MNPMQGSYGFTAQGKVTSWTWDQWHIPCLLSVFFGFACSGSTQSPEKEVRKGKKTFNF